MNKKFFFLPFLAFIFCQCQNNKMDTNQQTNTWNIPEYFNKTESKVIDILDHEVVLYIPYSSKITAKINTVSMQYEVFHPEYLFVDNMIRLNRFRYFMPSSFSVFSKYSKPFEAATTYGKDFYTQNLYNKLFLISDQEIDTSDGKVKYRFNYNKYGQLLNQVEKKSLIDKTLLENKYDEKSRLLQQNKDYDELKSKREYYYDDKNNILKEDIWEKKIAPNGNIIYDETYTLFYSYNDKGQLIEKSTKDKNVVYKYEYNEKERLRKELIYRTEYIKGDKIKNKVVNNFEENILEYDSKGRLIKEIKNKIASSNHTKLINHKWIDLNEKEQYIQAWELYKSQKGFFYNKIEEQYIYEGNNLVLTQKKEYKYNKELEQYEETGKPEITKYFYNALGQIVKKEIGDSEKFETKYMY